MRWVRDPLGRLPQRPHYDADELDQECEALVSAFLRARYGRVAYPLRTDDLTVLVEQETSDLDLYADLSAEGAETEGVTEFVAGVRPRVRITRALSEDPAREHRLRTTLAHELGHVRFHAFLWASTAPAGMARLPAGPAGGATLPNPRCRRRTILGATPSDWLEWQAGYASGAVLMPAGALDRLARQVLRTSHRSLPLTPDTARAQDLISGVQAAFNVSREAARVRLVQRGYVAAPAGRRGPRGAAYPRRRHRSPATWPAGSALL